MSIIKSTFPRRLVFVDTETTGTQFGRDRVIEIGLVLVEDNQIVSTFTSLVNPQTYVSPFITQLTGISPSELESAPKFSDLIPTIEPFFADSVFVAHNARFDFAFFKSEYLRLGQKFNTPLLCTVRLSRALYPKFSRHNLDSLIRRHQLPCQNRHRAFDDAMVIYHFYSLLLKNKADKLESTINSLLKTPSLPPRLNSPDLGHLKNTTGVYIFKDEHQNPLYVGKSKNLKNRILSHFSQSSLSPRELTLANNTASIETIETPGELGAFLLESRLVKELMPVHNRQLRLKKELLILQKTTTAQGYLTAQSTTLSQIDSSMLSTLLGIFRSKRQLQSYLLDLAQRHQLCPKLLGIDHSKNYCFSYHLGNCLGACKAKENPLNYNLRFLESFSSNNFIPWPFKSPIIITETNSESGQKQAFIVDRWILISQFNPDIDFPHQLPSTLPPFDFDIYKILKRFILNPQNQSLIHPLPKTKATNSPQLEFES